MLKLTGICFFNMLISCILQEMHKGMLTQNMNQEKQDSVFKTVFWPPETVAQKSVWTVATESRV